MEIAYLDYVTILSIDAINDVRSNNIVILLLVIIRMTLSFL